MFQVLNCIVTEHDPSLAALAAIICALGCFTAISLIARSFRARRASAKRWQAAAVIVFSFSVWSLHFVAMIGFLPARNVGYQINETLSSLMVVFVGVAIATWVVRRNWARWLRVLISGLSTGLGIAGMHYLGVAAMRHSGLVILNVRGVIASIILVVIFACLSALRAGRLRSLRQRVETAGWLVLSICSLHFTGMAALSIAVGEAEVGRGIVLASSSLALMLGVVNVILLLAFLASLVLEQRFSEQILREHARMRLLSNLAHEVLLIEQGNMIREINVAGERLFEMRADKLIGQPLDRLFSPTGLPVIARRQTCPPHQRVAEEVSIQTASGREVFVEISCQPIDFRGEPATAIALRDLTAQKRDQARILHLARHDAVTGLPNRYNLEERLESAVRAAGQDTLTFAVLYVDLDHFKEVNDVYGHAAGDMLLKQVAERMALEIQPLDCLARVGGDEFVIILQANKPLDRSSAIGERILSVLNSPFLIEGDRAEIGASIGIALYPADGSQASSILRAADTAMYRAKEEGRNAIRYFEPEMDARLQARRRMEHELRSAIERSEMFLHYQPIVNGKTGEIEAFEALLRWRHPERGLVSPADFIPVAESTGLITAIGDWVIDAACREAASWPHPWRVSVNVSPAQMRQSDIGRTIRNALKRHGLPARRLFIEITEGVLINNSVRAVATLTELRNIGVRLALDDFGTGYSSLSYLQKFRFDKLKIDKSFVDKIGENSDALSIVRAITMLGHNLGLKIVAEGVETEEQLDLLRMLGCTFVQGYLLGKPRAVSDITEIDVARIRALWKKHELLRA